MEFYRHPGVKSIPSQLDFTILVAYPSQPTPFTLDLQFSSQGETGRWVILQQQTTTLNSSIASASCSVTCDGELEIKKSTDPSSETLVC